MIDEVTQAEGRVVIPAQFAGRMTQEALAQLEKTGVLVSSGQELADLELAEPGYGEMTIDTLKEEEVPVFIAMHTVAAARDEIQREIGGDVLMRAGEGIKSGAELDEDIGKYADEELIVQFYRLDRQYAALQSMLFWGVCERNDCHDWVVGVRSKGRIVKVQRKW